MPPIEKLPFENIPERVMHAHPPPLQLYKRGVLPSFDGSLKFLAVVGARKYSDYGEKVCRDLIKGLRDYPIVIISGLALGIDSIAHESALDANLVTIAVPGSGLNDDALYPQTKFPLAKKILASGGCLISEYSPETRAMAHMFPERNRIMAALSDAVLIIEAERKSGTMITARIAVDYNKDVFTIPGSIYSALSEGPHFLLRQGATPITCSKDIVESLGLTWKEAKPSLIEDKYADCSPEEVEILTLLRTIYTRDEIIRSLPWPTHKVQSVLTLLEIKGLIKEEVGRIELVG